MLDLLLVIGSFTRLRMEQVPAAVAAVGAGVLFYFTTKPIQGPFDYTFRVAEALLRGHLGLTSKPPSWLNEFVLAPDRYYSVFPLGAVLVNIPAVILVKLGLVHNWPAHGLAAIIAAGCTFFFHRLTYVREDIVAPRRLLLAICPVFATWIWCNLGFAGAWQLALGFAVLGQVGALYHTLIRRNALLAGMWFTVAIGNRTELLLALPAFLYLLAKQPRNLQALVTREQLRSFTLFLIFPAGLLLGTAAYNWARFGSMTDFGYAHIPGVLKEPWYQHGIFSLTSIRWNAYEMLFRGLNDLPIFPYLKPYGFGCSIFLASPFLVLLFREGGQHRWIYWSVIGALTFALWAHGNPGGWQFSYRYAMILLPWMFLLITENGPPGLSAIEVSLFSVATAINAIAAYEFLWTSMIKV